jgi:hypothetical protein
MAARLGRVIYWFMCGVAVLVLAGGAIGFAVNWPGKAPPEPAEAALAAETFDLSKNRYTFTFPSGARYELEAGTEPIPDFEKARVALKYSLTRDQRDHDEQWENIGLRTGLVIGTALFLFLIGRSVRYILANE